MVYDFVVFGSGRPTAADKLHTDSLQTANLNLQQRDARRGSSTQQQCGEYKEVRSSLPGEKERYTNTRCVCLSVWVCVA